MKKQIATALILSTTTLSADYFYWETGISSGYRNDKFESIFYDDLQPDVVSIDQSADCLSSFQLGGYTKMIFWEWIEIGGDADYAWIQNGDIRTKLFLEGTEANGSAVFVPLTNTSDGDGSAWDAFLYGALRIPFYCGDCFSFAVIAQGGYAFNYQTIKRRNSRPAIRELGRFPIPTTLGAINSNPTFGELGLGGRIKQYWCGPLAGGYLDFGLCSWEFSLGYTYHWVELDQTFPLDAEAILLATLSAPLNTDIIGETIAENVIEMKTKANPGHRGWISLGYVTDCCWRFGIRGTYFRVDATSKDKTTNSTSTVFQVLSPLMLAPGTKQVRAFEAKGETCWETYSVLLDVSYRF